jgi:hypothetical protein
MMVFPMRYIQICGLQKYPHIITTFYAGRAIMFLCMLATDFWSGTISIGAWGGVVVKALRCWLTVLGSIPGGVTGVLFHSYRQNHVP